MADAEHCGMRNDYIEKNDFYMANAKLAAQRSKDPLCRVGAVIVNNNDVIVGIGYNCMPKGKDSVFTWKKPTDRRKYLLDKGSYVCHAELNAIVNSRPADIAHCIMFVTRIPCDQCAKLIVQSDIKQVYYIANETFDTKKSGIISKWIFRKTRIPLIPWEATKHNIEPQITSVNLPSE